MLKFLLPFLLNGMLFTFDDGPDVKITPQILRILKKHKIKAVFCIPAVHLYNKKQLRVARQAVKDGHVICNHSYNHPNFARLTPKQQRWQIRRAQQIIKQKLGVIPTLFRPPEGVRTRVMYAALRRYGLKMFMWDIDSRDWSKHTTRKHIYNRVIKNWRRRKKQGKNSIVLFHDTNKKTLLELEKIIIKVKNSYHLKQSSL